MEHPDEIIPHLEPGRLPSTVDPDAIHTSKKGKLPQQPVRISAWNLAKLNPKEAIKAGEKARASSSVLRPVSSKNHPHESSSGKTSPMTKSQNQDDLESCGNTMSNLSNPHPNGSTFDHNREHYNPVYQSSANQSPFSRASEKRESTIPQEPTGRNLLSVNESTRASVVWDQEAGRFVSTSTRSVGLGQALGGTLTSATSSYYQQGRSQRGGQLPVFVPSDSQQSQFSNRLP